MASTFIEILSVFDTQTILKDYAPPANPTPSSPIGLPHPSGGPYKYMFMVAKDANTISGQATGNLSIRANVNDQVQWRSASLSDNGAQSAIIYKIQKNGSGADVLKLPPEVNVTYPYVPVPDESDPTKYKATEVPDYFLSSLVRRTGVENYLVYFYITDIVNGKLKTLGYYYWDPAITVDPPTT